MKTSTHDLDKIADEYHLNHSDISDIHIENICQKYFIEWIKSKLNKKDRVLELGYGDGLVCEALYNIVNSYTLIEGSERLIKHVKTKYPEINCIFSLFEDFKPESKYDFILAAHVLEHLDDPVKILISMKNWLSDEGLMVIVVPNRNSLHRQLAVQMGLQPELDTLSKRDLLVGHQRVYSLQELKTDIYEAGYTIKEELGFFIKPLPNSMMLDYSEDLIWAMNTLSNKIPVDLTANLCLIVEKN